MECSADFKKAENIIMQHGKDASSLIQVLILIQEECGYISKEMAECASKKLSVPLANVYSIITFYDRFKMEKPGKYSITCCQGTACFVKGGKYVLDEIKKNLGIGVGETTEDGMFSLNTSRCLSNCSQAAVVDINKEITAPVKLEDVSNLLESYKAKV